MSDAGLSGIDSGNERIFRHSDRLAPRQIRRKGTGIKTNPKSPIPAPHHLPCRSRANTEAARCAGPMHSGPSEATPPSPAPDSHNRLRQRAGQEPPAASSEKPGSGTTAGYAVCLPPEMSGSAPVPAAISRNSGDKNGGPPTDTCRPECSGPARCRRHPNPNAGSGQERVCRLRICGRESRPPRHILSTGRPLRRAYRPGIPQRICARTSFALSRPSSRTTARRTRSEKPHPPPLRPYKTHPADCSSAGCTSPYIRTVTGRKSR